MIILTTITDFYQCFMPNQEFFFYFHQNVLVLPLIFNRKFMKKYTLINRFLSVLIFVALTTYTAKAQYSFGATFNYAFATDDLAIGAKNGLGGTFHVCYTFSDYLEGSLNAGYVTFQNKNTDSKISPLIDGNSLYLIPVTLGVKVYIASADDKPGAKQPSENKWRPYFGLDLGWATGNLKLITDSKNYVVIAPQFGIDCKLSESFKLRFSAMNNLIIYNRLPAGSDVLSYVGLNVGGIIKF